MSRRADRELPGMHLSLCLPPRLPASPDSEPVLTTNNADIESSGMKWARTVPIFLAVLLGSTLAIFNYQKSTSPVVASALYALRTSPKARAYLGDEIYFASKMPWIWGEMNQLHGRIDIRFEVKGDKAQGTMRFRSMRRGRQGLFETAEWSLEMAGSEGERIDLLDGGDPFKVLEVDEDERRQVGRGSYAPNLSG